MWVVFELAEGEMARVRAKLRGRETELALEFEGPEKKPKAIGGSIADVPEEVCEQISAMRREAGDPGTMARVKRVFAGAH